MTDDAELRAATEILYQGMWGTPVPPYLRDEMEEMAAAKRDVRLWMETPNPDPDLEEIRQKLRRETP